MPALTATRPAAPFEDAKARVAAAVEAARDEIVDLSHRIHADPEPAFEETHAAAWVAEVLGRHGFTVEHPAGSLATAIRATLRGRSRRRAADRDPRRVRRASRARSRLRPQHDGRLGGRGGDRPGRARRRAPRRDRLPGHAGRGTGERQADHDRRRPVRGPRRGAAVPPVRSQPRRELPARVGGRRRRLHGPPVACLVGPVARQERARRADPAVHLGRACGASSCTRPRGSTASSARAGRRRTSSRTGHRPGS